MWRPVPLPSPGRLHELLFPSKLVQRRTVSVSDGDRLKNSLLLAITLVVNLLLYAVPPTMTYAERYFAMQTVGPALFTEPASAELIIRFASQLLFVSVTMFAGFYIGLRVMRLSPPPLAVFQSLVDSTGIYLATSFTLLQYAISLPTGGKVIGSVGAWAVHVPTAAAARVFGVPFREITIRGVPFNAVPTGLFRTAPDDITTYDVSQLSGHESIVLALLAISVSFYIYAFYCSARIDANTTRATGLIAVGAALAGPYLALGLYLLPAQEQLPTVAGFLIAAFLVLLYNTN